MIVDIMDCSVISSGEVIGKKWTIPIIEEIALGKFTGFNEFSRDAKVTPHILSLQLNELEAEGLIRKVRGSPKTTYWLTEKGVEMHEIILKMKKWNIKWGNVPESCLTTSCTECGR